MEKFQEKRNNSQKKKQKSEGEIEGNRNIIIKMKTQENVINKTKRFLTKVKQFFIKMQF